LLNTHKVVEYIIKYFLRERFIRSLENIKDNEKYISNSIVKYNTVLGNSTNQDFSLSKHVIQLVFSENYHVIGNPKQYYRMGIE
jgi:hypothetical protein